MKHFKIPINNIGLALKARNINIPGGSLKLNKNNIPVTTTGEYTNIEDIKNTIVGMSETGNIIYLKDVAEIVKSEGERDVYVNSNGQRALLLTIKYSTGVNIVDVGEEVKKILAEYDKTLPNGMDLTIITDQSEYVNDAIKDL